MTDTALPIDCSWCGGAVSVQVSICPHCSLPLSTSITKTATPAKAKTPAETVKEMTAPDFSKAIGIIAVGIDPGARYTGVSVIDEAQNIYVSSTYYRPDEFEPIPWLKELHSRISQFLKTLERFDVIGIEGVSNPKGFKKGSRASLNPRDIIHTGILVGGLSMAYPDAYIIKPGGNGDRPKEDYPPQLNGRRPSWLNGIKDQVTTRNHERSAFDVAEKTIAQYKIDNP